MASPKFLVFKLKDLRIPALILLVVVALFIFLIFKNKTTQTFAPSDGYQDGKYIAGITLSDADMDLVVEVQGNSIISVSLSGLDESSSSLYKDLISGINYINTYVTATQSLELPQNGNTTTATMLLMDAVKVALSDDANTSISTTYEKVNLTPSDTLTSEVNTEMNTDTTLLEAETNIEDIFVDEFEDFDTSTEVTNE
ncbi:MAG: hypothetical protein H9872_07515 [Candidatus Cellulosilyticum pullistercoris]|uniref:FMN-binding domain-containing protein n=1 Tax=Candidatus Cellulosilyticum pullistercoris TaxID=2838521 RepID=A0A9E2NLZ0_9FIRM|nr:hypothetical protein [Candidatus Cellulosilyticum pullistercoris]